MCELGGCLRAVLRDVLCGHLDPALRNVADELRVVEEPRDGSAPGERDWVRCGNR